MSCCGARNFSTLPCKNFDRGHSLLLASSATGSARKRPHFDISPYEILERFDSKIRLISRSANFGFAEMCYDHFDISPQEVRRSHANIAIIPQIF